MKEYWKRVDPDWIIWQIYGRIIIVGMFKGTATKVYLVGRF